MTRNKIYVASSWRNKYQPEVVKAVRAAGLDAYDFRDPHDNGGIGFQWTDIDPKWQNWDIDQYVAALSHPIAEHGFGRDMDAMKNCDGCILVLPSGRSAHAEAGWFAGQGLPVWAYIPPGEMIEPELMYNMFSGGVNGSLDFVGTEMFEHQQAPQADPGPEYSRVRFNTPGDEPPAPVQPGDIPAYTRVVAALIAKEIGVEIHPGPFDAAACAVFVHEQLEIPVEGGDHV